MRRIEHALHMLGDYPNALRVRARSTHIRVPAAWSRGRGRPVVLIPGIWETWHFLQVVGDALNERGHPVHVVRALRYNGAPIPVSAERVARELANRDLRGVAIVAHSKGGLIGKQLMTRNDPEGRIDRLIAIATPFGGSSMARLTLLPALRAFLPTNAVIKALGAARQHHTRLTSIYPRFDPNIPEGSRVDGAENIEIPVIGHFRILDDPRTVVAVIAAVQREV